MPTVVVETSVCVMGLWPAFLKFSGKLSAISSIVIGSNKHLTTTPGSVTLCNFSLTQPRPRPSSFIYIFLIFSAFSHEMTGTR